MTKTAATKTYQAARAIMSILLSGEQTEDHVRFACIDRGIDDAAREDAICDLLDDGQILPTLIQADELGIGQRRFVAALRRT